MKDLPDNHDLSHLHAMLPLIRSYRTALDIGAHRGIWTKVLTEHFDRVLAFEPTERYKRITDKAEVHNVAVGNRYQRVSMRDGAENTGQSHVVDGSDVDMIAIDSLNLSGVDFIKIDVEGLEYEVIEGAYRTILWCHPAIMIEENGLCERYGYQWGEAGKLLESMGYHHSGQWNKDHLYI